MELAAGMRQDNFASVERQGRLIVELCEQSGYDYEADVVAHEQAEAMEQAAAESEAAAAQASEDAANFAREVAEWEAHVHFPIHLWGSDRPWGYIERADVGDAWPFTIDSATLHCTVLRNYLETPKGKWLEISFDDMFGQAIMFDVEQAGLLAVDSLKFEDEDGIWALQEAMYGQSRPDTTTGTTEYLPGLCDTHFEDDIEALQKSM